MPTYDYRCDSPSCGHITEEVHSIKDIPQHSECEECGSESYKILPAKSDFILKGGGWFREGY
jgi:putative FmdB family regulatory protein